ncbi:MAG: hypothetical protein AAF483_26035, partial [Planctomycetota bacterium]
IIVLAEQRALNSASIDKDLKIVEIPIESLEKSAAHNNWIKNLNKDQTDYWLFTRRRFLFLMDLMSCTEYDANVIQLETDNLLFYDVSNARCSLADCYSGIAATFNNDFRCIPGLVYVSNAEAFEKLADEFAANSHIKIDDMRLIGKFSVRYGKEFIDYLPVVPPEFVEAIDICDDLVGKVGCRARFAHNAENLGFVFDGSSLGQFLGGTDYGEEEGFVTKESVVDPIRLSVTWELDQSGRKVPIVRYQNDAIRLANLHVQSKRLDRFCSLSQVSEH